MKSVDEKRNFGSWVKEYEYYGLDLLSQRLMMTHYELTLLITANLINNFIKFAGSKRVNSKRVINSSCVVIFIDLIHHNIDIQY